jgi:hypothetical protein
MLSGTLSGSIKNLASLKSLHLESNKFYGPLPPDIGSLLSLGKCIFFIQSLDRGAMDVWHKIDKN